MRFIKAENTYINMDLIRNYVILEETPNRVSILADGDKLFQFGSRWEAETAMEKIINFSTNGNGVFNPVED